MNNKGFTLVELLATIVILGIVMGIASYGVISAINSSKDKSQDVFVGTFVKAIDSYLSMNASNFEDGNKDNGMISLGSISLNDLINAKFIDQDKFVNPKNKMSCYKGDFTINVYRDDNYVYYYKMNLEQLPCFENESSDVMEKLTNKYNTSLPD